MTAEDEARARDEAMRINAVPLPPEIQDTISQARSAFFAELGPIFDRAMQPLIFMLKLQSVKASAAIDEYRQREAAHARQEKARTESQVADRLEAQKDKKRAKAEGRAEGNAGGGKPAQPNRAARRAAANKSK